MKSFEQQWQDFLKTVSDPSMYTNGHKAMAKLGYNFALGAVTKCILNLYP